MNARIELNAHVATAGEPALSTAAESSVAARAEQAQRLVAPALPDARLAMIVTDAASPTQ